MKELTFHINNYAYTIKLGDDPNNTLEKALKKFLSTEKNLTIEDVLLAYLNKTQEFITFQEKLQTIMMTIPSLEKYKNEGLL